MKYKAIFCDFDGTLYRDDHTVSSRNLEAIRAYLDRGGKFVISTGRLFQSVRKQLDALGLNEGEVIVCQGAGVYDASTGRRLWAETIRRDYALECARFIDSSSDVVGMMYIDDECYAVQKNEFSDRFVQICGIDYRATGCKLEQFLIDRPSLNVTKLLAMVVPSAAMEFCRRGERLLGGKMDFARSQEFLVEMMQVGVNKGKACEYLCRRYGIEADESIALGDSENDLPMIRFAGLGVAMGNAFDNVKEDADYVAPSNDDDGVAHVIEKFCLGREG